jgi:hypothetical protein
MLNLPDGLAQVSHPGGDREADILCGCAAYGRAWGYGHVRLLNHESSECVPFQSPIGELRKQARLSLKSRMNAVQT